MAKKKSNPQSDDNKPPKTQHQPMDDAALHSLKSLNAMLLKETVERRQQVDSLTQVNVSLESELNRCKSELNERAVMLEIEAGLVSWFVAVQVNEMAEVNRIERAAMEEKICGFERDISGVLEEKNVKESEIGSLNSRLKSLVAEISEEKFVLSQVCEERDEIRAQLDDRIHHENELRLKLAESEKKSRKLKVDYNGLLEEKTCVEREKDSVARSLAESNVLVNDLKRDIHKVVKEKTAIEDKRNELERTINEMQVSVDGLNQLVHSLQKGEQQLLEKVADLEKKCVLISEKDAEMSIEIDLLVKQKQETQGTIRKLTQDKSLAMKDLEEEKMKAIDAKNTILTLEKCSKVQTDKLKRLESEASHYKSSLDQATIEGNKTRANLDDERLKAKNLNEKLSKMEKGLEEIRNKLSKMTSEKNDLETNILAVEKSLVKSQKEHDVTKAKLERSEANSSTILKILKKCISNSSKEDDNKMQETEFRQDHVRELEAIKKCIKERENVVQELKKQMEVLKESLAKADKGKSFWTMVSSATTLLAAAAVSMAFVAGGH